MLNLAMVGLGRWGQTLIDAVQGRSEKLRFKIGVVRRTEPVAAYATRQGLELSTDYAAVLTDPAVHGVVLATPHSQHAAQVIAAAKARKPVLVEKPFTLDRASAEAAVAACRASGTPIAFAHNRRFLPAIVELKRRIDTGLLGRPLHIEGNFSSRRGYQFQAGNWRTARAESPAGGMTAHGIHQIDAMIHLVGRFARVYARSLRQVIETDADDTTSMLFDFESGMTGAFTTVTASAPMWRLRLLGSKGWAEMLGEHRLLLSGDPLTELAFPPISTERAELEAFADLIEGGKPYPVTAAEAIHGVAVLAAIVRSAASGTTVEVG